MQMMAPPEDAAKERSARIDERFDRTDERILDVDRRVEKLAEDTNRRFDETNKRITETSVGLKGEIRETKEAVKELGQQMHSVQITYMRGHFALVASVVGAIFALLAKG